MSGACRKIRGTICIIAVLLSRVSAPIPEASGAEIRPVSSIAGSPLWSSLSTSPARVNAYSAPAERTPRDVTENRRPSNSPWKLSFDSFSRGVTRALLTLAILLLAVGALAFYLIHRLIRQIAVLESKLRSSASAIEMELTLRKKAQTDVEDSLREKEVLLREVHHRVKNNLQMITSILNLQLRREKENGAASVLHESSNRIQSIAILHEMLYRNSNLSRIALQSYFWELARALRRSFPKPQPVDLKISGDDYTVEIESVIPLGLILTELFTNSIKYAFPSGHSNPSIAIEVASLNNDTLLLKYADNGIGFPVGFSTEEATSLGWRLIHTLVGQLRGRMKIASSPEGIQVEIHVPEDRFQKTFTDDGKERYDKAAYSYS